MFVPPRSIPTKYRMSLPPVPRGDLVSSIAEGRLASSERKDLQENHTCREQQEYGRRDPVPSLDLHDPQTCPAFPPTVAARFHRDGQLVRTAEGADEQRDEYGDEAAGPAEDAAGVVVRATGGLDDTIQEDTGFKFSWYSTGALYDCLRAALGAYRNRDAWTARMIRGMKKDFSWAVSADAYSKLYEKLLGRA